MDNLSLSAEERFENFCQIPNSYSTSTSKHASYIGVTPEFLVR
jgi:hypothetical protein